MMQRVPVVRALEGSFFVVHRGDTLSRLIEHAHGATLRDHAPYVQQAMLDNRHLRDPDRIHPGDMVFIRRPGLTRPEVDGSVASHVAETVAAAADLKTSDSSLVEGVARFGSLVDEGAQLAFAGLSWVDAEARRFGETLTEVLKRRREFQMTASVYKRGMDSIYAFSSWGPRGLFVPMEGAKSLPDVPRTVERIGRVARFVRGGGFVLKVVDVPFIAMDAMAAHTFDEAEKIVLSRTAGLAVGLAVGHAVGVSLMVVTGPVGLGLAVVLTGVGLAASHYATKGTARLHDGLSRRYENLGILGGVYCSFASSRPFCNQ